ncbi:MAG: hypothetical protein ACI9OD_003656 [Limisphaerales bacterium]|jgi:hypothetical protein
MNSKTFLILSLAANVLLGMMALRRSPAPTEPISKTPPPPAATANKAAIAQDTSPVPASAPAAITGTAEPMTWEKVESADYQHYIENLRSIGVPEETIRDIILADVEKLYKQKKRIARGPGKKFEYWKGGNPFNLAMDPEAMEKMTALEKEKNALIRELGIAPDSRNTAMSAMMNPFEAMMDFLPESKKTEVMETMMNMQAKMAQAQEGGQPDPKLIDEAQKEMERRIKEMLTPQEYRDYEMRMSRTANMMRQETGAYEPTQEEFNQLYDLRKAFDDKHSVFNRGNESQEERKARTAGEKILKQDIEAALGTDRYEDYKLAKDWNFRQTLTAAKKSDLGMDEAKRVWEIKRLAMEESKIVRRNKELAGIAREEALRQIRNATENEVKGVFGNGWTNYNRGNNTMWLNQISPSADLTNAKN